MESQSLVPQGSQALATRFSAYKKLSVRQRKRWLEILLSFEMKNAYDVYDERQLPVLRVQELGSGFLSLLKRIFLGPARPFHAGVRDLGTEELVLELRRPFRFVFHKLDVHGPSGELLGSIERRWSWVRRIYAVLDAEGRQVAELFGPFLRPWTFEVRIDGQVRGTICKRWSGWGKELFTDADNFGVDIAGLEDPRLKALVFAATVLIDVVHFERAKGG